MGMNLDAGAHPGPMGTLKSPRAAPPAYLRSRACRCSGGAVHFNLVHVSWRLVIALLLATCGHSVWVVCQSPGLHTFSLVTLLVATAAPGDERTHWFSFVRSCSFLFLGVRAPGSFPAWPSVSLGL